MYHVMKSSNFSYRTLLSLVGDSTIRGGTRKELPPSLTTQLLINSI